MRPSQLPEKRCDRCRKHYTPQSNRQRFCSAECHWPTRPCEVCEKPFIPARHSSGRACSLSCGKVLLWKRWGKAERPPCPQCGRLVIGPRQKFCSRPCLHASLRRQGRCARCDKPTTQVRNRYCSRRCASIVAGQQIKRRRKVGDLRTGKAGYIFVKCANGTWRPEHRVVMEQVIGRKLRRRENVHHKNGKRSDNRPTNLELWKRPQPTGVRAHCPGCRCFEEPVKP